MSGQMAQDERIKTLAHERNVKDKEVKALRKELREMENKCAVEIAAKDAEIARLREGWTYEQTTQPTDGWTGSLGKGKRMLEYIANREEIPLVRDSNTGEVVHSVYKVNFVEPLIEIVRCRDCKHSGYVTEDKLACVNPRFELDCYFDVEPNGFCAWGEKK